MCLIPPHCVLVFDLDDTLYLERDFVRSGFQAVGKWARATKSLENVEFLAMKLFIDGKRERIFDAVLEELGIKPDTRLVRDMVEVYRFHEPVISLQPDTLNLLELLPAEQKLALVTDGHRQTQENKVTALGLQRLGFDPILITDVWGRTYWKPHRRAFETIAGHFDEEGLEFVYVGDNSTKDFLAPNAMGWSTIRIARAGRVHPGDPPSERHCAQSTIANLDELPDALNQILNRKAAS
ncbi:HAD family hydrolase [Aurantiacibacter poecillastricola]|uniref:HAD family hydrolase n=1 Tax=Aurantiacibacter poecillastricola TaxID=3064385 RepID=UPI00273E7576|nr:HAD family hydrolase [Aurantiacibacter sp. 219JJ12-13]MDP5260001.1 HAD family hydrolase [Aurantiacibacter sp. 219JJ12-13]